MELAPSQGAALPSHRRSRRVLLPILALGLVHALVYLCIFPPWQHYDEPAHFEYAALIARRGLLPHSGDYDLSLRREIASSMVATGFYQGQTTPEIDFWSDTPPTIGVDELVHPPLYYLLLGLALRPFVHQGVEAQLYVARLCSASLYLVVLLAAYKLVAESFPDHQRLPAAVAVFLALLPPLADRMSAVSSDVGAAATTSLMLWAAVALVRRGPSVRGATLFAVTVGMCLATKTTAGIVALTIAAVLAAAFVPRAWRPWLLALVGCLALAALALPFTQRGQAASWYSIGPSGAPNRVAVQTPLDNSAFVLAPAASSGPQGLLQELRVEEGRALRGHSVTLGGWVRSAEGPADVIFSLEDGQNSQAWAARATDAWQLYTFTAPVGEKARGVAARVSLPSKPGSARTVYMDGMFLVDARPGSEEPAIADAAADLIRLGDREVPNLLRNGSARRWRPGLPSVLGNQIVGRSPASDVFASAWDWRRTGWVLKDEADVLFRSFWGGFGWNHLALPDGVFSALLAVTGLALAGAALALARQIVAIRQGAPGQWRAGLVLAAALAIGWGMVFVRIHPVFVTMRIWWPVARYADAVIVPSAILLCGGLAALVPRRLARPAAWTGLIGLLALDALSLGLVILPYYYG